MPAKPFDINEYVKSLKLSAEDEKAMIAIVAKPEVTEEIKRGWNSQSESSRLVDEANTVKAAAAQEKTEAERIRAEAEAKVAENKTWHDKLKLYEADANAALEATPVLTAEKLAYEAYLRDTIGIDPALVLDGRQPSKPLTPVVKEQPVAQPTPATLDADEMKRLGIVTATQIQPAINLLGNIPFELNKIQFKHARLYGKEVPDAELDAIQEAYLDPTNQRSLSVIAAEKLHFTAREEALEKERIDKLVEARGQELYTQRLSELNLPAAGVDTIQPNLESVVHFNSKGFTENSKRPSEGMAGVSAEEMADFLAFDQQLAAQGIRPTTS